MPNGRGVIGVIMRFKMGYLLKWSSLNPLVQALTMLAKKTTAARSPVRTTPEIGGEITRQLRSVDAVVYRIAWYASSARPAVW